MKTIFCKKADLGMVSELRGMPIKYVSHTLQFEMFILKSYILKSRKEQEELM